MSAALQTPTHDDVVTLDSALAKLVVAGEITDAQAHGVHDSFVAESAGRAVPAIQRATGWTGRLIEVGAYLGAALVAAGGVLVVGQQWEQLGLSGQLAVLGAVAVALFVAGFTVVAVGRTRHGLVNDPDALRRLASTLLTLSAAAAAGFVARGFLPDTGDVAESRLGWMFLSVAAVAGLILVAARLAAPSALAEIGLYGTVLAAMTGVMFLAGLPDSPTPAVVAFFGLGVCYTAVALLTRWLTVPTLGTVLGLATALFAAVGEGTTSRVLLALLAVGCFVAYFARPRWPLVTVALLAAVAFSFSLVGNTFGPAVAMLVSGVLLLVLATSALLLQRRRSATRR